jgi:hypothetical protein
LAQNDLETIRHEVRNPPPPSSAPPPPPAEEDHRPSRRRDHDCDDHDGISGDAVILCGIIAGYLVASPFWAPHAAADEGFSRPAYFQRAPYCDEPGYMVLAIDPRPVPVHPGDPPETVPHGWQPPNWPRTRKWSCRLRTEYADSFGDFSRIGGHMLLESTSRFGLDGSFAYLHERLPGGGTDQLALGDFNIVFRFAQNERVQFRSGLGVNWLDDETDTDFGFNFTYGADLFPLRPLITSATIDWGTLGHAGLFRFRTTAGVVFVGIEAYTGYEYLDIGSTQTNSLIGGVRIWL